METNPYLNDNIEVNELIKKGREWRDYKTQLETSIKENLENAKYQIKLIDVALQQRMEKMGLKSLKSDYGTVSVSEKTAYTITDHGEFREFVRTHPEGSDLIQMRLTQSAVKDYQEQHPELPPGVTASREVVVTLRKPSKSK